MNKFLTKPEFAEAIGVCSNTVTSWENKGLIKPHHRSLTRRSYYTQEQVDRILSGVDGEEKESE